MKPLLMVFFFMHFTGRGFPQDTLSPARPLAVGTESLSITLNFTTNLIFPYAIATVDIGSRDVLAKKSGPAENVLLIKAGRKSFTPTNLSVYTRDGRLYSYRLVYADSLNVFNYSYAVNEDWSGKPFLHLKAHNDGMKIRLSGIYTGEGVIWMTFRVTNHSAIDYFLGSVRFRIRDKKHSRKMVVQEESWEPLYSAQAPFWAAGSGDRLRYGFAARAPDKKKEIVAEWADQNGERRIRMVIPAKELLKARVCQQGRIDY